MNTTTDLHPKFVEAMEAIERLPNREDKSKETLDLFFQVFHYAPDELRQIMREKADEMGLVPKTDFVDDDGNPVFSVEQIAKHFDMPVKDVQADIERLSMLAQGDCLTISSDNIHRKQ